jgi:hypothetical protein
MPAADLQASAGEFGWRWADNHRHRPGGPKRARLDDAASICFLNLLAGPQLLDKVGWFSPDHRERMFPPTETGDVTGAVALGG